MSLCFFEFGSISYYTTVESFLMFMYVFLSLFEFVNIVFSVCFAFISYKLFILYTLESFLTSNIASKFDAAAVLRLQKT